MDELAGGWMNGQGGGPVDGGEGEAPIDTPTDACGGSGGKIIIL